MEREILQLLQQSPDTLFSVKEIGRKIDRKQFKENPNWARPFLEGLVRQRQIMLDEGGTYYYYPKPRKLGKIV